MKKSTLRVKSRSFTLIEILIAVSIFIVVSVITMAIMTMSISTKSKVLANNELRIEASKIMAEIQDMVEKGNTDVYVGILDEDSDLIPRADCNIDIPSDEGRGAWSHYLDVKGWHNQRKIRYKGDTKQIEISNVFYDSPTYPGDNFDAILPTGISASEFKISGVYRNGVNPCGRSTRIIVTLTLEAKTRGFTGQATTLTLRSTFVPKYPNPDKAGDSEPPSY